MKKILFVLMLTVIGNTFTAPKSQKTKNTRITTSRISENDRKEIENTVEMAMQPFINIVKNTVETEINKQSSKIPIDSLFPKDYVISSALKKEIGKKYTDEIIKVDGGISKENLEELLANYIVENTDWSYEEIDDNDNVVDLSNGDIALFTTKAYDKTTSMIYDILGFTKMPKETLLRLYNKKHDIIKKLTNIFSCKDDEILEMLDKSLTEKAKITAELKSLSMKYAEIMVKDFENSFIEYKEHKILIYNEDENLANILAKFVDLDKFLLLSGYDKNFSLNSNIYDCKAIILNITKSFPTIKGGGGKEGPDIFCQRR